MPRPTLVVSSSPMSGSDQTRLLLVEDVPQVTQHIRGLLNAQGRVKLLDVLDDGTKALGAIQELRPDVVVVALLQGGSRAQARRDDPRRPVISSRSPRTRSNPVKLKGIHGVLSMPFSGFDLMTVDSAQGVRAATGGRDQGDERLRTQGRRRQKSRGRSSARAADGAHHGSLQFGDPLAPESAGRRPVVLDLPTDRMPDPTCLTSCGATRPDRLSGAPRIEMAEMIATSTRCRSCVASTRRRHRHVEPPQRHQPGFLDASDVIISRDLRLDDHPHRGDGRHVPLDRLPGEGALPRQPGRSPGGIDPIDLERARRVPSIASCRTACSSSSQRGVRSSSPAPIRRSRRT